MRPPAITATFGARALARLLGTVHLAIRGLLEQIDALSREMAEYEQRIAEIRARHAEVKRLAIVPGWER